MTKEKRNSSKSNPIRRLLLVLGPGFVTGASDDDPSGIGTYAAAGASLGFATLWTALVTFPLMAAVQFICAKVAKVTGRGLAGVLKKHYSPWVVYPAVSALVIANTINAGADIGAIAAAISMLIPVPILAMIVPITAILVALQFWGSYTLIERTFKWLTLALFAYVATAFFVHPDAGEVLKASLVPVIRFDSKFLATLTAILGTTISPYLFFWQTGQEVEEEKRIGRTRIIDREGATNKEVKRSAWDVTIGMLFSNVVMYFIILTTAATLFKSGKTDIQSATDAAKALEPLAGGGARLLLALGLIGTGFLAVPVLTGSAGYALSEAFGWKHGLDHKPHQAKRFYIVIGASMLIAMQINFMNINPISALFWTAVINGFLAPPLLVFIMLVSRQKKIMGKWVNGRLVNVLGWLTTAAIFAAVIALMITWMKAGFV